LARPFQQRLFFAGEATHVHDYSTAHGAHDSGVRAAEEVIAALASAANLKSAKGRSSVRPKATGRASSAREK
jgi:monoamine oxidase